MEAEALVDSGIALLRRHKENFDTPSEIYDHAVTLLQHALGRDFDWEENINGPIARRFHRDIARRATGEPLSYIIGYAEFLDLKLTVKPGGFIPRATTEFLATTAIDKLKRRRTRNAVDAATGVGPVALAMAHKVPGARVWGTDISSDALRQARANARRLGLDNISFLKGSMLAALPDALRGRVDVITSHPPYVARSEIADLPAEVRDFEPVESLTDDQDGLALIRLLVREAPHWLRSDGWLLIEVGTYIARPVRSILTGARYSDVRSTKGSMPYTRVLVARSPL